MKYRERMISRMMRNTLVSCSDRNSFTVSTSDVQRWIRSPVRFSPYQEKRIRSRWEKREFLIRSTSVSAPMEFKT